MKRIFISGGCGFVGEHLIGFLRKKIRGCRLRVLDNLSSRKIYHLEAGRDMEVIRGDIKNKDLVIRSMKSCDTVFHLAANPDIAKAVQYPEVDFYEGTLLTNNILEGMRINQVKKIFYTSGSGVYGENASLRFSENHGPCIPISTYGASKLASEALIASYVHMFGIQARVFRFANVVGRRQTHGVGYDFVKKLRQDPKRLVILGDGSQRKSYIHVEDILEAMFHADQISLQKFDVFNVATGESITVREIADVVCQVAGLSKVRYCFTGGDRGWKGDVPIIRFDCRKILKTGWRPQRNSRAAVTEAIQAMWAGEL